MIDYGPGDEIVCIHRGTEASTYIGRNFVCVALGTVKQLKVTARFSHCVRCGKAFNETILAQVQASPRLFGCSCWFRKKLDFKKLCNVDETQKIKENA